MSPGIKVLQTSTVHICILNTLQFRYFHKLELTAKRSVQLTFINTVRPEISFMYFCDFDFANNRDTANSNKSNSHYRDKSRKSRRQANRPVKRMKKLSAEKNRRVERKMKRGKNERKGCVATGFAAGWKLW